MRQNASNLKELEDCRQYIRLLQAQKEKISIANENYIIQEL